MMRSLLASKVFTPKTYDIDFIGHVNNIVYVRWLEDLRLAWLERWFPLQQAMNREQIVPVLLKTAIVYRKPVHLFDKVEGVVWISESRRSRYEMSFEFTVNGELRAEAVQDGAWLHRETGRPARRPKRLEELWTNKGSE